jgi:hypothetical protein
MARFSQKTIISNPGYTLSPMTGIKWLRSNGIMIIMIGIIIMAKEVRSWVNRFQLSRLDKS